VQYYNLRCNGEGLKMTEISNNPKFFLWERNIKAEEGPYTSCKIARIKKDMKYCVKNKEKDAVFTFPWFSFHLVLMIPRR
jgi:hypothetical protein